MKNKKVLLSLCAIMLVAATIFGTLAYLTSTAEVKNTFTVGDVEIKLDEAVVDANGQATEERTEEGNEYHLLPGYTYDKDPTVTVLKGSEESFVRILVTINKQDELDAIFAPDGLPLNQFFGGVSSEWTLVDETENTEDNTRTYEFRYNALVDASEATDDIVLDALFETIIVPAEIDNDELATIEDLEINIVAQAIQTTPDFDEIADADAAWAAFNAE